MDLLGAHVASHGVVYGLADGLFTPYRLVISCVTVQLYMLQILGEKYIFFSEVVYADMLAMDPNLITSLRWLSRDHRHPMNKLVTKGCRSAGIIHHGAYLDSEVISSLTHIAILTF